MIIQKLQIAKSELFFLIDSMQTSFFSAEQLLLNFRNLYVKVFNLFFRIFFTENWLKHRT
jgi:hypothetical protein